MTNNKRIWWVIGIVAVLGILFYIPRIGKKSVSTDVPCLVPNLPLVQHIHPTLKIIIDGQQQTVPADVGLGACERAIHTHDSSGLIHVESQDSRQYTLGDFFGAWSEPMEKTGYALTMTVNGQPNAESNALPLKDGQEIILNYKKQ